MHCAIFRLALLIYGPGFVEHYTQFSHLVGKVMLYIPKLAGNISYCAYSSFLFNNLGLCILLKIVLQWVPLNIIPLNRISRLLSYKPVIPNRFLYMLSHTFYWIRIIAYYHREIEQFLVFALILSLCACVIRHSTTLCWSFVTLHSRLAYVNS